MARLDPHSWNDSTQPQTRSFDWKATVDFASRTLVAEVTLHLKSPGAGPLDLDTRDLAIDSVEDASTGRPLAFDRGEAEAIVGTRLRIILCPPAKDVRIRYRTSPNASALQWLAPEQTAGKTQPYLFSQCQAIHARSVVPLQDTPRLRVTYTAALTVPRPLRGLMAAAFDGREERDELAIERWRMPQPIAPYLFAFVVGELASRDLGPRSRVWAEPSVMDAAAWEFADVDRMLAAGEALFGPYDWERFDLLVMPPSFPYGGMENPRLTFVTPTLLAKDRSLVDVVAHELAHSWTGNLVTNANAEHFWLTEGFPVYAERRIDEALLGVERRELSAALGRQALERSLEQLADRPELTRLRTHLHRVDPDDAYSQVPYEKGYLLLRALEEHAGRARFDRFLRTYLGTFRFQAITTDDFARLCERELPGALAAVHASAYFDEPGLPQSAPAAQSAKLAQVRQLGATLVDDATAQGWSATEWQLYLELFPRDADAKTLAALDCRHHLTASTNWEILAGWLTLAAEAGFAPARPRIEAALGEVGRMKYLRPLYTALAKRPETRALARRTYERARPGYHPIARQLVEGVLAKFGG